MNRGYGGDALEHYKLEQIAGPNSLSVGSAPNILHRSSLDTLLQVARPEKALRFV